MSDRSMPPPKLRDVAQHAGVSMGTVSHVLNHPDKVSEKTRDRVRASIEALGFVRDANASSLAAGGSRSIGLVVIDLANSLFVDLALGAKRLARASGLNVLLADSQNDLVAQGQNVDFFIEARAAGLLLAPMRDSSAQISRFTSRGRPVVVVNYDPGNGGCCVIVDNEQVGYLAADHLITQGCRRVLFLGGDDALQPVHLRRQGVLRRVAEASDVLFEEASGDDLNERTGAQIAARVLRRGPATRPDGVIGVTDTLAAGFLQAIVDAGVAVPGDVAVMGCDHNTSAAATPVPLTTVAMNGQRMGEAALKLLLGEIAGGERSHVHQRVVVEPELVARGSTMGFFSRGGAECR